MSWLQPFELTSGNLVDDVGRHQPQDREGDPEPTMGRVELVAQRDHRRDQSGDDGCDGDVVEGGGGQLALFVSDDRALCLAGGVCRVRTRIGCGHGLDPLF